MSTRARHLVPLLSLALGACSTDDSRGSGFGATAPPGATSVTTATTASSSGEPTTSATGSDTSGSSGGATSEPTTSGGGNTTGVPNPDGLPNGSECTSNDQCMTGNCYKIMIPVEDLPPGICSECDQDADCVAAGTGISCTVDSATLGGVCTDGSLGSFCETQNACKDPLYCEPIVDGAEGLLPLACSDCRDDADCTAPMRCVPAIDVVAYTGKKSCVAPGTVANDGMCPLDNGGPMCLSGICEILDIGGLLQVGVCSECDDDGDCTAIGLTTCLAPKFDSGLVGRKCM